jgi:nucleoside-diphosphate-sugar epimerase
MSVLLTGHLGYIGPVLTPMLLKTGHRVVGLDSEAGPLRISVLSKR